MNAKMSAGRWTEFALAFGLMTLVLFASNTPRTARFTGLFAAALVAIYIPLAAPVSGMSLNPARTIASAVPSGIWTSAWIYFTAPPLAMLTAAECYVRMHGQRSVYCAKLHHDNTRRCIFCETRIEAIHRNRSASTASKSAVTTETPTGVAI